MDKAHQNQLKCTCAQSKPQSRSWLQSSAAARSTDASATRADYAAPCVELFQSSCSAAAETTCALRDRGYRYASGATKGYYASEGYARRLLKLRDAWLATALQLHSSAMAKRCQQITQAVRREASHCDTASQQRNGNAQPSGYASCSSQG